MPGIFGLARHNQTAGIAASSVVKMETMLRHRPVFRCDPIFSDERVSAGRCHTAIINKEPQPFVLDDISLWFDGEVYNAPYLQSHFKASTTETLQLFIELYKSIDPMDFLPLVDGIFAAVLYDRLRNRLIIMNDRYGMRHLYLLKGQGIVAWSPEIKALAALPQFSPDIDGKAVADFLQTGCFIDNETWFKKITLLPPASIHTFSFVDGHEKRETYWTWGHIKPFGSRIDVKSIAVEWGHRFRRAVEKRIQPEEHAGLTLSGGLDSRAILAAFPGCAGSVNAGTFGMPDAAEIRIAARAAAVKKANHHVFNITAENWFLPRIAGVWATDGQVSILDMHGIESMPDFSKVFNISLNGMGGDGIHGGSFLTARMRRSHKTSDPYGFRGRRFIRVGTMLDEPWMHIRFPFYDNDLLELVLALPEEARKNARFYRLALLEAFPEYFKEIPWQKTGMPISMPGLLFGASQFFAKAQYRTIGFLKKSGLYHNAGGSMADYPGWLRIEPARGFFEKTILSPEALYRNFTGDSDIARIWKAHSAGADHSVKLGRYCTLEVWLQQILNGNLVPDEGTHFSQAAGINPLKR